MLNENEDDGNVGGAMTKPTGRPPLPPDQRRELVTARLPRHLIDWMDTQGKRGRVIEEALKILKILKEHREQHHSV